MKFLIIFFGLLNGLHAHAQDTAIANYNSKIEFLLAKLKAGSIADDEKKELRTIAFDLQNRGQLLDESKHDFKGSLEFVSYAISIFRSLKDTLNVANNLKFRGYLLGRLGKFDEGKNEIKEAINLFRSKDKQWGVAVSNFDMSRLYEFENKPDSAIHYCILSLDYWKTKNTTARVFNNQNMLINLLSKSGQASKAKLIQQESEVFAKDPGLHWQDMIDFYFVSHLLYETIPEPAIARQYQDLYDAKLTTLKHEGIIAMSYFSNLR